MQFLDVVVKVYLGTAGGVGFGLGGTVGDTVCEGVGTIDDFEAVAEQDTCKNNCMENYGL